MESKSLITIAVGAAAFALVAVILVFVFRAERARRAALEKAWRAFANRSSWRFHPAAGPWFARKEAWVEGDLAGAPARLEQQVVRHGKSTSRYTRFLVRLPDALATPFEVDTRTFWRGLGAWFRPRAMSTGDARFDARFTLRARDERAARTVDAALRERLLDFPKPIELRASDREVALRWDGTECEPSVLDRGEAILGEARRALGTA